MEFLLMFAVSMVVLAIIFYVIRVVALHKLMSYAGLPNPWLSFIPLTEFYIFYRLLDGTITMSGKVWDAKKTRNILYRLPYGALIVSFVMMLLLTFGNALIALDVFSWFVNILFMVLYGIIGLHFSRVYLNKTSPVGVILAVLSPSFFYVYVLVNLDEYRKSVDRLHNPGVDFDGLDEDVKEPVIELTKDDVSTVDNETLEELFTDVKVENDIDSGIHLTKVVSDSDDSEEEKRKIELAKAMFDAEVAALEAEKEFEEFNSEALEADIKALEAEFELAKVEEESRLREESERVAEELRQKELTKSSGVVTEQLDLEDEVEVEIEEESHKSSVYGSNGSETKSFTYDNEIDLTDSETEK